MSLLERPPVRRVREALRAAGAADSVIELAATARTAEEAATACGVPLGAIVKTLAFASGDKIVLALIAGDRRCDMAELQAALALPEKPGRATPDAVKAATGFTIGGVAPVGHPQSQPLPIAIDSSLGRFDHLFAAAGHPHCVFATTFNELCRMTGAIPSAKLAQN